MTDVITKEAFTPREFAKAYGVPIRRLYRLWADGTGPERTRIGKRKIIITRPAGEKWLSEHVEGGAVDETRSQGGKDD